VTDRCVCGHPDNDHRETAMSVPLVPNPTPLYPLPSWPQIGRYNPNATYERRECHCGCCAFDRDLGRD